VRGDDPTATEVLVERVEVLPLPEVEITFGVGAHTDHQTADQACDVGLDAATGGVEILNGFGRLSQLHDIHTSEDATTPLIMARKLFRSRRPE